MTTGYVGPNGQWVEVADTPAQSGTLHWVATPPATASSAGQKNQFSYDATHLYICIDTDTWVRGDLATW